MYLFYMFEYWTWALAIVTRTISSLDFQTRTLVPLSVLLPISSAIITDIFGYYYWPKPLDIIPNILGNITEITGNFTDITGNFTDTLKSQPMSRFR